MRTRRLFGLVGDAVGVGVAAGGALRRRRVEAVEGRPRVEEAVAIGVHVSGLAHGHGHLADRDRRRPLPGLREPWRHEHPDPTIPRARGRPDEREPGLADRRGPRARRRGRRHRILQLRPTGAGIDQRRRREGEGADGHRIDEHQAGEIVRAERGRHRHRRRAARRIHDVVGAFVGVTESDGVTDLVL
jgi:hypothetical protein